MLHAMFLPFGIRHGLRTPHCFHTICAALNWAWTPHVYVVVINHIIDIVEHTAIPDKR